MVPPNSPRPGSIVRGPTLPEPVEVLAVVPLGDSLKIIGRGLHTGRLDASAQARAQTPSRFVLPAAELK